MSVDLGKSGADGERGHVPGRELSVSDDTPTHDEHGRKLSEREAEKRQIKKYDIDERRMTPLGLHLPKVGFVPDMVFQGVRWVGLGTWIFLYAITGTLTGGGFPWPGFVVMWLWIGANAAYESATKDLRRQRKRELRALKLEARGGPDSGLPVHERQPLGHREGTPQSAETAPATSRSLEVPRISEAEKALVRTVRRVDTSDRFERTDLILVHEVADLLGPLLARVAERGADPQVRHDLETLAGEHLPRTVDDYLALPADFARDHLTSSGTTPAQELRNQLHLLLEGCEQLRDSVHDADVDRQQQQSRFLEAKFRRSDLDL